MTTKAAARNEADGYLASHRITFVPQSKDMKTGDGTRAGYTTISARGLDWDSVPMRLFQKAKRLGTWDPQAIDLGRDASDWSMMTPVEKDFILRTVALFQAGEEGVTKDLLPLIMAVAQEGRLEEEIFLTSFLWEEAKHVELFRRWLDDVAAAREDLSRFLTPSYSHLFLVELPAALGRLKDDPSASAQIRAAVTYNMVIEGVVTDFWDAYDETNPPFGQRMQTYIDFASSQFDKRMKVLERDRGKSLAEIERSALADLEREEAAVGARA